MRRGTGSLRTKAEGGLKGAAFEKGLPSESKRDFIARVRVREEKEGPDRSRGALRGTTN